MIGTTDESRQRNQRAITSERGGFVDIRFENRLSPIYAVVSAVANTMP